MKTLLIVFLKAPEPGKVKTRLIPDLGQAQATAVHLKLVEHVLEVAKNTSVGEVQCWVSGSLDSAYIQSLAGQFHIVEQHGEDLGARMLAALNTGLQGFDKVAIVGGDAYSLTPDYIEKSFSLLDSNDVVLGPADDGGYILIAATRTHADMFEDIQWGTDTVLQTQVARFNALGLAHDLLETRWDIDTIEDIQSRAPELIED